MVSFTQVTPGFPAKHFTGLLDQFFNIQEAVIQPGSGHGTAGCHETSAEQKLGTKKWSRGNGTMLMAS